VGLDEPGNHQVVVQPHHAGLFADQRLDLFVFADRDDPTLARRQCGRVGFVRIERDDVPSEQDELGRLAVRAREQRNHQGCGTPAGDRPQHADLMPLFTATPTLDRAYVLRSRGTGKLRRPERPLFSPSCGR
jgi:hypothetical protein